MRFRLSAGSLLAFFCFLLMVQPSLAADFAKSYVAKQFNVSAALATGGILDVTEQETFQFIGGPFTTVTRSLPTDHTDGISVQSVRMDDQVLGVGETAGHYEVTIGNPITITWHFSPTSDASHTFSVAYQMRGVIQKKDVDLLDWKPLPIQHDYVIDASTVTLSYPSTTSLVSTPDVAEGVARVTQASGQVQFTSTNVDVNQTIELGMRFRFGSLITVEPNWQRSEEQAAALYPYCLGGGILIFLLGSLYFILRYRKYRRGVAIDVSSMMQVIEPPSNIPPAIATVLVTTNDGTPTWDHALAALFDLIDREVVTVVPPRQWNTWVAGQRDFQLELIDLPTDLYPHEIGLLKMLFRPEGVMRRTVSISEVGNIYRQHQQMFSEALRQEMASQSFFEPWRQRVRTRLGWTTLLIFVLSLIAAFIIHLREPWPVIFLPLGFTAMSITALFLWASFSTYTNAAIRAKVQWESFMRFMRQLTTVDDARIGPALFGTYLPYSAGFGLLVPWAKALQRHGELALPGWFKRLVLAGNQQPSEADMGFFVGMIEATIELNQAKESGGTGDSHVSGSSGASGGGSSSAS